MWTPADVAGLISAIGAIMSGIIGYGVSSFKIGRWEGSQEAKMNQVIADVAEIKQWDFAKLAADVADIKATFVLMPKKPWWRS